MFKVFEVHFSLESSSVKKNSETVNYNLANESEIPLPWCRFMVVSVSPLHCGSFSTSFTILKGLVDAIEILFCFFV